MSAPVLCLNTPKIVLRLVASIVACLGLLLALSHPVFGQALSGVVGTVTDSAGGTIAGARVTATNDATGVAKTVTTNSSGSYEVTDLIPGAYTIKFELAGFETSIHNGVGIDVGRFPTIDASLAVGNTNITVEVKENAIAINTTQPDLGTTIENAVVKELPLQVSGGRGRQIDSFIFLAPGVTGSSFSHRINGGVDFQNEVVFNGVPMAQSETQGFQTIWNPPFELVNEFNVLRSSFSAQYGLAQGVVTYHTTSGSNKLHGDVFEILRNNFFDARGAYNDTTPVYKENNYGFSIGGPIIIPHLYNGRNRTFFFATAEWDRLNQAQTGKVSLPTAAEKAGNFSALPTIFDPQTGKPFPNNTIPQNRFSPLAQSLLQYSPDPQLPGVSNNQTSFLGTLPTRQNPWGFTIDHNITEKQSIHWSEWRDPLSSFGTKSGSQFALGNPLSSYAAYPDLGTVFILNYSNTITPNLVVTAGASWLGELNNQLSLSRGVSFAAAPGNFQLPGINFNGPNSPTGFGSSNTNSVNRKLGFVADNNYLWILGKHTLNFGFEFRRTWQDDNECQQCAGNFNFSNNQTADPNNLSNTGNSFASFLLGQVDSADRIGSQELRLRNADYSPYIQDDIKLRKNLTINIGIRWDVMVPFNEANNTVVFFNSKIPNPAADGLLGAAQKFGSGFPGAAGFNRADIKWNHITPRFGFSYSPNSKTVIQGGISQNYLNGGAYEYGISKVAVNYGNLLLGSYTRNSTGSVTPGFGSWDTNILPGPGPTPFSTTLGTGSTINGFSRGDGIAPYSIVWSGSIQRELPYDMLVTASYTGNRGRHLPSQLNPINQLDPKYLSLGTLLGKQVTDPAAVAAGIKIPYSNFVQQFGSGATVLQALLPYPQYASIFNNFDMTGSAAYEAMQIQVEKHYTNGLSFLVSYNLSQMMSNTSSGFSSFANAALNKNNQKAEWSIDNNDQPQILNIAGTYELPIGPGKMILNRNNLVSRALSGWQFSPLVSYLSGTPIQVGVAGAPLGTGGNRPNIVPGQKLIFSYNNIYKGLPVLNAAAFSDPGVWAIGNEPRYLSGARNPAQLNENFAIAKSFPVGEHVKIKLEMEYFNALNRVIFCGPDTYLPDANFGKVVNCQANSPRQGQAHFTITF